MAAVATFLIKVKVKTPLRWDFGSVDDLLMAKVSRAPLNNALHSLRVASTCMRKEEEEEKTLFVPSVECSHSGPVRGVLSPGLPGCSRPSGPYSPAEAGSRGRSWSAPPPTVKG